MSEKVDTTLYLQQLAEILQREPTELVQSISKVQGDLAHAVERSRNNLERFQKIDGISTQISTRSVELADESNGLQASISVCRQDLTETNEKLGAIGKMVSLIEHVADQTKLLALNATIEASWAGEAGKGFSIVAREVKDLSEESRSASVRIRESVSEVTAASKKLTSRLHQIEENALSIGRNIAGFVESLSESSSLTHVASEDSRTSNSQIFTTLAKLDHILWKVRTYSRVIEGTPTFEFVDSTNCRLGKWFHHG